MYGQKKHFNGIKGTQNQMLCGTVMALMAGMLVSDGRCSACSFDRAPLKPCELVRRREKAMRILNQLMEATVTTTTTMMMILNIMTKQGRCMVLYLRKYNY